MSAETQSLPKEKTDFSTQAITWAENVTCYYLLRPSGKVWPFSLPFLLVLCDYLDVFLPVFTRQKGGCV